MNIFLLAYRQLEREGLRNSKNADLLMLDRAKKISNYLSNKEKGNKKKVVTCCQT